MRHWYIALLCLVVSNHIPAQEAPNQPWEPHGSAVFSLQQRVLKPRTSRLLTDQPQAMLDLTVNLPFGLYVRPWIFSGINDIKFSSDLADEFDFYIGWKGKVAGFDLNIYTGIADFYPLEKDTGDVLIQSFNISKTFQISDRNGIHKLRPEMKIEWLSFTRDFSDGAYNLMPCVTYTWAKPFGLEMLTVQAGLGLQAMSELGRNDDGVFLQIPLALEIKLNEHLKIVPNIFMVTPLTDPDDGRKRASSVNLNVIWSF